MKYWHSLIILTVLSGSTCNLGSKAEKQQNAIQFTLKKDKLQPGECYGTTMLSVVFESGFKKEFVQIYINNKIKYADTLSTSPLLGLANSYIISKKNLTSLKIRYNGSQLIEISELKCYKSLYVTYQNDRLVLNLSNELHQYK